MSDSAPDSLPGYERELAAYHRAFGPELAQAVELLPIAPGMRVLDLACGDGAYTVWLAERLPQPQAVIALDALPKYLRLTGAAAQAEGARPWLVAGDVAALPLADDAFDLAWCAQSLFSLPDPAAALRAIRRIVRPGGLVALLENDSAHQLILSWPHDLELAIRVAELEAFRAQAARHGEHPAAAEKFYIGRRLPELLAATGWVDGEIHTLPIDRIAPLASAEVDFLTLHLTKLAARVRPHLQADARQAMGQLLDPASPQFLLAQPAFSFTWLNMLAWARRPAAD